MCLVFEHANWMTGWGCCLCRTYNGLWRDKCKNCSEPHCPLGRTEDPDILFVDPKQKGDE